MFSGPAGLLGFGSAVKLAGFGTGPCSGRWPGQQTSPSFKTGCGAVPV